MTEMTNDMKYSSKCKLSKIHKQFLAGNKIGVNEMA